MTQQVLEQLAYLNQREYRNQRLPGGENITARHAGLPTITRAARRFAYIMDQEEPVFHLHDWFGFNRNVAALASDEEIPDVGFGNVTVDYETALSQGLSGIRRRVDSLYPGADSTARQFYDSLYLCFDACGRLAERYRSQAQAQGYLRLARALERVPMEGARDYHEALILIHFMQYALRISTMSHVTLGRFDQYAYPYFQASLATGSTREELLELTELFFISLNFDSDLYHGVQRGDNGQSMVLGGCLPDGSSAFNALSEICLEASEALKLIDPKINLRVSKDTPLSLYERGTRLTRQGLGFPQYSNDDVVIPGLIALGYDPEDAWNYTVAACWEFIIPRCGADIPNYEVMNFPLMVDRALRRSLRGCSSFDSFLVQVKSEIEAECDTIMARLNASPKQIPNPFLSAFLSPCIEQGRDFSDGGAKYNNFGIHGAGIANAADALAAIRSEIFEQKSLSADQLLKALDENFQGHEDLRRKLLACPKMGNNDDAVDELGAFLMDTYSAYLNRKPNHCGGIYRAGTGSAMEYIYRARQVGATADGRPAGEPYGSSFSPSLHARLNGPLSAVQSFTKFDMRNIINGGPFTIEIHDTVFRNDDGERKVAQLVKSFIDLGGHQIQINAINRDRLLDAQKHPEKYPNLIVRVWGWSGYFNELDMVFQDHIIRRAEFTFG